jgi:hypothetical protein
VFAYPLRTQTPTGTIGLSPGEQLFVKADVTGPASVSSPILLGIRVFSGPSADLITQKGLTGTGAGLLAISNGQHVLSGVYTVPQGVDQIQVGVWKYMQPRHSATFAVDDAEAIPLDGRGGGVQFHRPSIARGIARYLLPTYAPIDFRDVRRAEENYRHFTAIDPTLTTNSIYAPMRLSIGNWAFALMAFVVLVAAALAGHASRYRSYFLLAMVVAGYCFAEYWRTYLFNFGIIHFMLLTLVLIPIADALVQWARRRFR